MDEDLRRYFYFTKTKSEMKKVFLSVAILVSSFAALSQSIAINTNGQSPDPTAVLDLSSDSKGVLIPRLGSFQRAAIASPAEGLLVFDTGTKSFWYYSNGWKEISTGANGGGLNGTASGDLSGNYPSPTVVKLQGRDVADGMPADRQALKWDLATNSWKNFNDSLFLPYDGTATSPTKLFAIVNTSLIPGSSAIYGRSGNAGSGISLGNTASVWGDNLDGHGVLGTSQSGAGIVGMAGQYHGIVGISSSANYAAVFGSGANNGTGVLGQSGGTGAAIKGMNTGLNGVAGWFENSHESNTSTAVDARNAGLGKAGSFLASAAGNLSPAVEVKAQTQGDGLYAVHSALGNTTAAVRAVHEGAGFGIMAQSHTGFAGRFETVAGTSTYATLSVSNPGLGDGIRVYSNNSNTSRFLFSGLQSGSGGGMELALTDPSTPGHGVLVTHQGTGNGIQVSVNKGSAGFFYSNNSTNNANTMYVSNAGTSSAGYFTSTNTSTTAPTITAYNYGAGAGLMVNNMNNSPGNYNLAIFKRLNNNVARIDGTGKGFFNGGTQAGGADVAEVFDVEDHISNYETGDVLIISTEKDRRVVKSNQAYSSLVAGVYATKPGMLMTEEDIDADLSDKVPMGVLGVIPTKVCEEGGAIRRGDLLVTSSTPGVAMKGDPALVKPGQTIGKALENFSGTGTGKIRVLVNVR